MGIEIRLPSKVFTIELKKILATFGFILVNGANGAASLAFLRRYKSGHESFGCAKFRVTLIPDCNLSAFSWLLYSDGTHFVVEI